MTSHESTAPLKASRPQQSIMALAPSGGFTFGDNTTPGASGGFVFGGGTPAPAAGSGFNTFGEATATPASGFFGSGTPAEGATASGKRRSYEADDDSLEAMLSGLTNKLGAFNHADEESLVATVREVLGIDTASATFYLEACNNDPHAAVEMYVSSSGQSGSGAKRRPRPAPRRQASVPLSIAGLPEGWSARVSVAGTVVFMHDSTGREQAVVPPGFVPEAAEPGDKDTDAPDASMDQEAHAGGGFVAGSGFTFGEPSASGGDFVFGGSTPAPGPAVPPPPEEPSLSHDLAVCDGCEGAISGIRYKCLSKSNFDLCEGCMWSEAGEMLRVGHKWMKMSFVSCE